MSGTVELRNGYDPVQREALLRLLRDYERGLGVSLCFQNFETELASFPGEYRPPDGALIVALGGERPVGLVALRALDRAAGVCEMKRLYVDPAARGQGIARRLADAVLAEGRRLGYSVMRLDTLPSMQAAQVLYATLGFTDIANYNANPVPGVRFLEKRL